jgi:hypothetical protein
LKNIEKNMYENDIEYEEELKFEKLKIRFFIQNIVEQKM